MRIVKLQRKVTYNALLSTNLTDTFVMSRVAQPDVSGVKRRRRTPLSCMRCRQKKTKCDRTKPSCLKCANLGVPCHYDSPNLMTDITRKDFMQNRPFVISLVNNKRLASEEVTEPHYLNAKYHNGTQTMTEEKSRAERESLLAQIEQLKNELADKKCPYDPETECISLVIDYDGRLMSAYWSKRNVRFAMLGTALITTFWKRDPFMCRFVKNFFSVKKKVESAMNSGKTNEAAKGVVQKYFPSTSKIDLIEGIDKFKFIEKEIHIKKKPTQFVDEQTFCDRVIEILPPEEVFEFHLQNFFSLIYPFIPIIDEPIFRVAIKRIVQYPKSENADEKPILILKTKVDHIRISILLLILRLSYQQFYLASEFSTPVSGVDMDIRLYEINPDIIQLVQFTLFNFNFLRKTSIEVYQLLLLFRYYQTVSCEDSDGYSGSDGPIVSGFIHSTFTALGLGRKFWNGDIQNANEDLSVFETQHGHMDLLSRGVKPFIHLWKKLRLVSFQFDLKHAMLFGCSPKFDEDLYLEGIEEIEYSPEYSNLVDCETEAMASDAINKFQRLQAILHSMLKSMHDVRQKPSIAGIERTISQIESLVEQNYDLLKLRNFSSQTLNNTAKSMMIQEKLKIESTLIVVDYTLLLHCEHICSKGDPKLFEIGSKRFKHLLSKHVARCISMTDTITFIWKNITDKRDPGDNSFAPYLLMLGYTFNEVFPKLTMSLFYIAIRLSRLNGQADTIFGYKYTTKKNEYQKMYRHILTIFRVLICIGEQLSHYWYNSLRCYSTIKNFVEWFENGGKFVFDFDALGDGSEVENQENLTILVNQMLLGVEDQVLEELNLKFELSEQASAGIFDTLKVNAKDSNSELSTFRSEMATPNSYDPTRSDFQSTSTMKTMSAPFTENEFDQGDGTDINPPRSITIAEESNRFFRSLEMNDWDDVASWFTQTPLFDSMELESFNKDFEGSIQRFS